MKTKILIIEHDPATLTLIQDALRTGRVDCIIETVQSENGFEKAVLNFKPDLILCNYISTTYDGEAVFGLKQKLAADTPFIFISESIGEEKAVALIKNGATDFVLKERLETLANKIKHTLNEVATNSLQVEHKRSEERRAEELSENESKYHSLVESSMDAILLTVKDGQILSANAAACKIFQMTQQEICAAGRFDLVDSTDPRLQPLLDERIRTGRAKGELTFKRKDGTKFAGEVTSVVFTDRYGKEKTSMTIRDISERNETEQKLVQMTTDLQQALINLTKILDSSLDLICTVDKEGKFVSVSAASERIWGYSPKELIGKKYINFVFSEDVLNTLEADVNIQRGLEVTIFENRYVHKDGHIVPMLWSSRWDVMNQLSYGVAKDATEKKNLEKAFEIERQWFQDLYSQAPSCMGILKGPNYVYELANDLYLQLIDRKRDIIGKTVKEVLPELEAQGIFEFLDTVYKTGETFSANEMLVKFDHHGNGQLVDTYLNFIYQAHRDSEGTIDGIFFFANDVTEQVLSRKKIEKSVLRYSSLIEQASDAICVLDASMKIIDVNRYACEKLGYSRTEFLQISISDFFEAEDLKANPLKMDVLKEGKTFRGERRIKRKDHTLIDVELSAKMLTDGSTLLFARDITEKKKAHLALLDSEKKYREIVETAQEGVWLVDENHQTTFVNNKMCQILGYTQEEMTGKEIYSFMDEEGVRIAAKLMRRKKEGKSDKRHFKYISKSGKEIWANIAANPLFDETGVYKGSLAMVTDITEIKKVQRNIKKNEKKYRYLFENNPMPMWIREVNTFKFLDVNKTALLQYGYSREEFLSMTAIDLRTENEKESVRQFNESFEDEPTNFNKGIWHHQRKNGTVIQVEIIAHKIVYEGVPAWFVLSNDITDRRKAELDLEQRNKELADYKYALNESSIVGITDRNGIIQYANDNFCSISKYSREELIGQDHHIISSEYHSKDYIQKLWETISSGKTWKGELKNKAKDGTFYWVDTTITPFLDEHGMPYQYVATRFDITQRKNAELSLEKQNKELIKTNSELDRFVYSVSHDLRSPLTSILGLLSFIEGESQETDTLEHAKMIRNSINRLDEFIKNILNYSRNNRAGLEIEKISLQEKAFAIVDSLQSMKEAKGILYEIDITEQQPFYTDRLRFNTILENLISNAIKHHKKGISDRYIKITGQSDHEKLQLTIADNGIGIEPQFHHKIFDMFFRLSGKTNGSGIGLYIVKDTLEILQGSIEIQSEKGIGTSFIITLKNLKP